jgi:hypothetical protein
MGIISKSIYYDIDINNMEKCYRVIILARSMLKLLVILILAEKQPIPML